MSIDDIPVRVIGPGSQPVAGEEKALSYIDMPKDMTTFTKPELPDAADFARLPAARESMDWLREALRRYHAGDAPLLANLDALDESSRNTVNQILGEGEVSVTRSGGIPCRTQESVLAGVWRTVYLDADGAAVHDVLEVADTPHVLALENPGRRRVAVPDVRDRPGIVNALPLLIELQSHCAAFERNGIPHSINLSLLPLADAELDFLEQQLGRGPVELLSRSYGKCQVISTRTPDVWWVRYYNSMSTLILNSLEVIDVPEIVKAAPEDLRDSAHRLDEILEPYWPDAA